MARTKAPPRVAQPDLERRASSPEGQAMVPAIIDYQGSSNHISDDEINHDAEKLIIPKTAPITRSEHQCTEDRSAVAEIVDTGHRIALTHVTCPHCLSTFPDMVITVSHIHFPIYHLTLKIFTLAFIL
jgi:hypothetical protein